MQKHTKDTLSTPLGRARNMGSAKGGTHHWWWQRVTSVALIPLALWFVYSLLNIVYSGGSADLLAGWLQVPANALLIALFIIALYWHISMGLQVIIEDYVHSHYTKLALLLLVKFLSFAVGTATLLAIIKLHLAGIAPAA